MVKINSLPNNKYLDGSKLKALADYKIKCDPKIEMCFGKGRNHGKRRKGWLPAFFPFPRMFSNGPFGDCVVKG